MWILNLILILNKKIFQFNNDEFPSTVDSKIIEKKRQDTLEICRLFDEQNNLQIAKDKYARRRIRREINVNPILNREDLKRVENIVDKLYDDIEDKGITYRRRSFNDSTTMKVHAVHRFFNNIPFNIRKVKKPRMFSYR